MCEGCSSRVFFLQDQKDDFFLLLFGFLTFLKYGLLDLSSFSSVLDLLEPGEPGGLDNNGLSSTVFFSGVSSLDCFCSKSSFSAISSLSSSAISCSGGMRASR